MIDKPGVKSKRELGEYVLELARDETIGSGTDLITRTQDDGINRMDFCRILWILAEERIIDFTETRSIRHGPNYDRWPIYAERYNYAEQYFSLF